MQGGDKTKWAGPWAAKEKAGARVPVWRECVRKCARGGCVRVATMGSLMVMQDLQREGASFLLSNILEPAL